MSNFKEQQPRPEILEQLVVELSNFIDSRAPQIGANLTELHSAAFIVAQRISYMVIANTAHNPQIAQRNRFVIAKRYMEVADDMVLVGTLIH